MNDVVDAFIHLLHDTENCLSHDRNKALIEFLRDFRIKRINPIHKRLDRMDSGRYVLSMVGLTNVGKSTLAQALLKYPVAPRRNGPATSIPVEYEHGPEWLMKTCSLETRSVQTERFGSPQALAQALERRVFDVSQDQADKIERVLVRGPMDSIEGGLVFADTPGFGAAQSGDAQVNHQAKLTEYVHQHVHEVLFCVSGANCTVKTEEVAFFQAIQELCSTVVVTKWDGEPEVREREIQAYKTKFAHLFPLCGFIFIEAKWAIEGQTKGTPGKLEESGVNDLNTFIRERANIEGRRAALLQQLLDARQDLLELAREPLRQSRLAAVPWRADGVLRLKAAAIRCAVQAIILP